MLISIAMGEKIYDIAVFVAIFTTGFLLGYLLKVFMVNYERIKKKESK